MMLYKEKDISLQTDEERFRELVHLIDEWVWEVNLEGICTYSSPKVKELLGYTLDEVVGKPLLCLMSVDEVKYNAEDFPISTIKKKTVEQREITYIHRNGSKVKLSSSRMPMTNSTGECIGFRGIDRGISLDSKKDLKQRLLVETIEASPDFIAIADVKGNIHYYNPTARDILGINDEGDFQFCTSFPKWACDLLTNEGIPCAIKNGEWKGEASIISHDGLEIPVLQTIVAHKSDRGKIEYLSTIARDITERKKLEDMMNRQALYDTLTGLPNRRHLYKILEKITKTQDEKVAFLFIDLDGFKMVNDDLGHHAGDEVLRTTATRLKNIIRNDDFVCRYAGDEFVIILKFIKNVEEISIVAERILKALHRPHEIGKQNLLVSGSIGISLYPDHSKDEEQLIKIADHAMYEVKKQGKGDFRIYNGFKIRR